MAAAYARREARPNLIREMRMEGIQSTMFGKQTGNLPTSDNVENLTGMSYGSFLYLFDNY